MKQVNPYAPPDTASQKGTPLLLQASASPLVAAPGEPVRIVVRVMDGAKRPVSEVEVQVTAGGGSFAGGGTSAGGFTDKLGEYTTSWSCQACAPAYRMDVKGQKDGYPVPSDSLTIRIRTAAQKAD